MDPHGEHIFDMSVWRPALERYGAVTHLTVTLYDTQPRVVCCEPEIATSLFAAFREHHYTADILLECAQQCLMQGPDRSEVIVTPSYGIAVVGTSLVLEGEIVGAAVAGFALVDFCQSATIASLARRANVPFRRLWHIAQQLQPVSQRRLVLQGELLQVLGDTILRESHRTHQLRDVAMQLEAEAAAKDEFLAVLSHELRTPLTPILGWARILHEPTADAESRRRAAESIQRNAQLQLKLVDDLLDLNRVARDKIALDIGVHDLASLLRAAVDTVLESASARQIRLDVVERTTSVCVGGDAARLSQVFGNVLSNAVKFTPASGHILVTLNAADETAIVRVKDTGEGISAQFLPHVFDIFRQHESGTRRRHTGLGIGLALVKRLVELHGGDVTIASAGVAQGTEVTIRLPLAGGDSPSSSGRPSDTGSDVPLANVSVLVIEDTEDNLEMMRTMLELRGAHVRAARNGLEALEAVRVQTPSVILCDLRMPEMDGFEFMQELSREHGPDHVPVLAVTGFTGEGIRERTRAAGFQGHVSKPIDEPALTSALQQALAHR